MGDSTDPARGSKLDIWRPWVNFFMALGLAAIIVSFGIPVVEAFAPEWWYNENNVLFGIEFEVMSLLSSSGVTIVMSGILGRMALDISRNHSPTNGQQDGRG